MDEDAVGTDLDTTADYPSPNDAGSGSSVLTRKYGPLPVWGWGVVVGGILLVFFAIRGRRPADNLSSGFVASSDIPDSSVPDEIGTDFDGNVNLDDLSNQIDELITAIENQGGGATTDTHTELITKLKNKLTKLAQLNDDIKALKNGTSLTGYKNYTIKHGDSIAHIAKKFGITVKQLKAANELFKGDDPHKARKGGATIRVPVYGTDQKTLAAKRAERKNLLDSIAELRKLIGG